MRFVPVFVACALLLVAALAPAAAASPQGDAIKRVNKIRDRHGLSPLRPSVSLEHSSARYARAMIKRDYFGHAARIGVANQFSTAGEALAMHTGRRAEPRKTVAQWMASPPHRALLLSARFREVGMGLARGRLGSQVVTTWVAHFGALGDERH